MVDEEEKEFLEADECWICAKRFPKRYYHVHDEYEKEENCEHCIRNRKYEIKVRDHSHVTGLYRGAAHRSCNLQFNMKPNWYVLPVVLHNFRGYDSHFIVKALKPRHGKLNIIAANIEKFLSMRVGRLRLLDSAQFTLMGLDQIAETMENSDFLEMKKEFSGKMKERKQCIVIEMVKICQRVRYV